VTNAPSACHSTIRDPKVRPISEVTPLLYLQFSPGTSDAGPAQGHGEADGDRAAVGAELAACGRRDSRTAGLGDIRRNPGAH
jgi:hypothetical protein